MDERLQERFLVWGAGGHGKVVADLVRAVGGSVQGFIDVDASKCLRTVEPGGAQVTMTQAAFLRDVGAGLLPDGIDAVALAIGNNAVRQECLRALGDIPAPILVHPSAVLSPSVAIGRGTIVLAGAVVNAATMLGEGVIINSRAIVEHDCYIGDGVHVSPGAVLAGGVSVGQRGWIGAGATIISGVSIGADAVVGAGAVVLRNVASGTTVAGVPARVISHTS